VTPELLSASTLVVCGGTILALLRFFGKSGLFIYSCIAVIASNIQVLKLTQYSCLDAPIALGTVLFSTTFAVDNILNEYYGERTAKQCVWLSFSGYLFFVIVMRIAVIHPHVDHAECRSLYEEINTLFSPTLVLFVSSISSYLISQFADIYIFSVLKKLFNAKYVTIRSACTMAISTMIDNCVFSLLAWVILADNPISLISLWKTYIFVTYFIRLGIAVLCVPLVKLSQLIIMQKKPYVQ
jgi:uncharacterized integral membrane protein (TIGR00697 family)